MESQGENIVILRDYLDDTEISVNFFYNLSSECVDIATSNLIYYF